MENKLPMKAVLLSVSQTKCGNWPHHPEPSIFIALHLPRWYLSLQLWPQSVAECSLPSVPFRRRTVHQLPCVSLGSSRTCNWDLFWQSGPIRRMCCRNTPWGRRSFSQDHFWKGQVELHTNALGKTPPIFPFQEEDVWNRLVSPYACKLLRIQSQSA